MPMCTFSLVLPSSFWITTFMTPVPVQTISMSCGLTIGDATETPSDSTNQPSTRRVIKLKWRRVLMARIVAALIRSRRFLKEMTVPLEALKPLRHFCAYFRPSWTLKGLTQRSGELGEAHSAAQSFSQLTAGPPTARECLAPCYSYSGASPNPI